VSPWPWAEAQLATVDRRPVDWPRFMHEEACTFEELLIGGRCAIPPSHTRIMPAEDLPWQAGEAAKAWMRAILQEHKPPRWHGKPFWRQQQDLEMLKALPPRLVPQVMPPEQWWVDLSQAYLQIYQPFSLDCVYRRESGGVWIGWTPFEDAERVKQHKQVGRVLIGHVRSTRSVIMRRGTITTEPRKPFWLQPHLYAMVQDTLNAVALDMLDDGAVAVETDAYCFPSLAAAQHGLVRLREDWRLEAKLKDQAGSQRPYRRLAELEPRQREGLRQSRIRALGAA
jgi:hypothetical protein